MTTDSGKKPAKEWKILNGRLIQDINGFKQEIAMAVHQDRLDEIQGESTLVREVTPCANCERLEEEKIQWEPQWKSNAEANASGYNQAVAEIQLLYKKLEMCKEALEFYADKKDWFEVLAESDFKDGIQDGDIFMGFTKGEDSPWRTARECLKAIDKEFVK